MSLKPAQHSLGRRSIPQAVTREAAFLEDQLPLQAFVTLTLTQFTSQLKMDAVFAAWLLAVQAESRATLGWIKAYEITPARHAHAVLLAMRKLDCQRAESLWNQVIGVKNRAAARVEPYRYGIGGLAYVMKTLDRNSEDVQFSANLSQFSLGFSGGKNGKERRQSRRLLGQIKRLEQIKLADVGALV